MVFLSAKYTLSDCGILDARFSPTVAKCLFNILAFFNFSIQVWSIFRMVDARDLEDQKSLMTSILWYQLSSSIQLLSVVGLNPTI